MYGIQLVKHRCDTSGPVTPLDSQQLQSPDVIRQQQGFGFMGLVYVLSSDIRMKEIRLYGVDEEPA